MSTHNILFLDIKKKIILNYSKSATMGFVPRYPRTSSAGKGGGLWGYYGRSVY